jgi:hypothetical protein
MAMLLANARRRPLTGEAHRPRRLHVRGHPQWRELFPHLAEIGIEVAVDRELPKVQEAYQGYLRKRREAWVECARQMDEGSAGPAPNW